LLLLVGVVLVAFVVAVNRRDEFAWPGRHHRCRLPPKPWSTGRTWSRAAST
jgi:hypothetical protein